MKLVLAEKPSVAQSYAKVLGANKRCDGYGNAAGCQKRCAFHLHPAVRKAPGGDWNTEKRHIINYSKTRSTYEEYRKVGYSKSFWRRIGKKSLFTKAAKSGL